MRVPSDAGNAVGATLSLMAWDGAKGRLGPNAASSASSSWREVVLVAGDQGCVATTSDQGASSARSTTDGLSCVTSSIAQILKKLNN